MKKQVFLLSILFVFMFVIFSSSFVSAALADCEEGDNDCKVQEAYSCVNEKIADQDCDDLAPEEKVFALLGVGKCGSEVKDDSNYEDELIYTAQAVFALKERGLSSSDGEDFLLDSNMSSKGIDWFLEIESPEAASCTVDYSNDNDIEINEDKTVSVSGGGCLTTSSNGYWVKIDEDCYDEEFEISCDNQFITTLLYQKTGADTIFVSESTHSASADGTTKEQVESYCFSENGNDCSYEGTLWGTLALKSLGTNIEPYLPYLIASKSDSSDSDNEDELLDESFLYYLTSNTDFKNQLLAKQISDKWWIFKDDKYFGTALALMPLQYETLQQKSDTIDWLLDEAQNDDGCFDNGNIKNTAFLLYSIWPKTIDTGDLSCEDEGYYCTSQISCSGQILSGYDCSGAFVCCSTPPVIETCSEQGGEICNSNQVCSGTNSFTTNAGDLATGQVCCVGGTCQEKTTIQENECESSGGICRVSGCLDSEQEIFESCDFSSDFCCVQETKSSGNANWLWITALILLIILVSLGIVFREKLRPYWIMIKSQFRFGKGKDSGTSQGPRGPPRRGPPSGIFGRQPTLRPVRRQPPHPSAQSPQKKQSNELDDVLKKLKDMGK